GSVSIAASVLCALLRQEGVVLVAVNRYGPWLTTITGQEERVGKLERREAILAGRDERRAGANRPSKLLDDNRVAGRRGFDWDLFPGSGRLGPDLANHYLFGNWPLHPIEMEAFILHDELAELA